MYPPFQVVDHRIRLKADFWGYRGQTERSSIYSYSTTPENKNPEVAVMESTDLDELLVAAPSSWRYICIYICMFFIILSGSPKHVFGEPSASFTYGPSNGGHEI